MGTPIIYGTPFSTYVRSVRIAFEEKPAKYELVDVSVIEGAQKQPPHLKRNPFGTVPAFEHDGLKLYETSPIIRYIDQVYPGAQLTPGDPRERAHMNQIISIVDYHAYPSIIGQIAVQRLFTAITKTPTDRAIVEAGKPKATLVLDEIQRIMGDNKFLAGSSMSLADLYVVPVLHYLMMTPEKSLMESHRNLMRWWADMNERKTVKNTAPQLG
jgi:glutathione S-transferase